jgi:hypothetical protein
VPGAAGFPATRGGVLLRRFITIFAITFVVAALVNLLWNLIADGNAMVEWNVPFTFAIILAIVLTAMRRHESRRGRDG